MEQEQQPNTSTRPRRRRLRRLLAWLILLPLALVVLVIALFYLPPVQDALRTRLLTFVQGKIGTPVGMERLRIGFPARLELDGLLLLDRSGDTLLFAREVRSSLALKPLFAGRIEIGRTRLTGVHVHLVQAADSSFNFDHIIAGFTSGEPKDQVSDTTTSSTTLSVDHLVLADIRFDMDLAPAQLHLRTRLGSLDLPLERMDALSNRYHAGELTINDAFVELRAVAGPPEPDPYPALVNPLAGLDLSVRGIDLNRSTFRMSDMATGDSMAIDLVKGELSIDSMDLARQRIDLGQARLVGAAFTMRSRSEDHPAMSSVPPAWLDQHDGFRYWTRGFAVQVRDLALVDGSFAVHQGVIAPSAEALDADHLLFKSIALHARDVVLNDGRADLDLDSLHAVTSDSLLVTAGMKLSATPGSITWEDTRVAIGGAAVRMDGSAFIGDPSRAYRDPSSVPLHLTMRPDVDRATLVELFRGFGVRLPAVGANERWSGYLAVHGTANDLDTLRVDLSGNMGTVLRLHGGVHGARTWPATDLQVDVQEITMGRGTHDLLSTLLPSGVPMPERLSLNGRFKGRMDHVDGELGMRSDLGNVAGTFSVAGLGGGVPDALDADLQLTELALARFSGDTAIGVLDARLTASGEALNSTARAGALHLLATRLVYHGQDLGGTVIDGRLQRDSLHADVSARAEAMHLQLRTDARWPAAGDTISGALDLRVDRLALEEFGWYDHPLDIHGSWTGHAAFSTEGSLAFALKGDSVMLSNANKAFLFERFEAEARLAQDSNFLDLRSDAIDVAFSTNVPVDSLLTRARERALSLFRSDTSYATIAGERMDLEVSLPRTEWLTDIVVPELKAIELREFTGHYDGDADEIRASIDLPVLIYGDVEVRALTVGATAHGRALDGSLHVDSARYGPFQLKDLALAASSVPGALRTELRVGAGDGHPEFMVPLEFQRSEQGLALHVREGLVLDTLAWEADPLNRLRLTEQGLLAEHFSLRSGAQSVSLATDAGSTTVEWENVDAGSLVNMISTSDSVALMDGELTGRLELPRTTDGDMRADLRIADLAISGTPLGELSVNAGGSAPAGYEGTARFENGQNQLDARMSYHAQGEHPDVQAHADLQWPDVSFLSPFVSQWLYKLNGGLVGTVDWSAHAGASDVRGDLSFTNTVIGAVATGARYELRNEHVQADDAGIIFEDFTVLDSLGSAFVLDGRVRKDENAAMGFDMRLRADSFRLVHRSRSAGAAFYGDLFTSADVRITGTDKAPVVKGDLGVLPGTDLSVVMPGSKVELVRSEGIVEFTTDLEGLDTAVIVTAEERMRDSLRAQLPDINMDLHLRIDPRAAFAVVLDPTSGDQATFKGTGDLDFRYAPDGAMQLRGPFTVSEGGYTLEFYGLVKKRFDLVPGSRITWQGDPMSARMDVSARYVSQSSAYPLVAKSNTTMSDAQRNRLSTLLPFEVIIRIGGAMHEPDINFSIDLPREYRNSYPQVDAELDRLSDKGQEEDRNKQVFGLLVFNSFIQDEGSGSTSGSELATSAARNSINGILTDQLNKRAGQLVKGVDVTLGVSTVDQTDNATTYQRTSLDYKVSKSFMNDRLSFQVGGSVGMDEKASNAREVSDTRNAQYSILYDLTSDGRYQVRGFYENAFDLYDGEITDSGVAIMLTREFEENEKARERMREAERLRRMQEQKRRQQREDGNDVDPSSPEKP